MGLNEGSQVEQTPECPEKERRGLVPVMKTPRAIQIETVFLSLASTTS